MSSKGLNQKPSEMRYRASRIAPLEAMLEQKQIGSQNMIDKEHTRGKLPPEQDRPGCLVPE